MCLWPSEGRLAEGWLSQVLQWRRVLTAQLQTPFMPMRLKSLLFSLIVLISESAVCVYMCVVEGAAVVGPPFEVFVAPTRTRKRQINAA